MPDLCRLLEAGEESKIRKQNSGFCCSSFFVAVILTLGKIWFCGEEKMCSLGWHIDLNPDSTAHQLRQATGFNSLAPWADVRTDWERANTQLSAQLKEMLDPFTMSKQFLLVNLTSACYNWCVLSQRLLKAKEVVRAGHLLFGDTSRRKGNYFKVTCRRWLLSFFTTEMLYSIR